jgi:peptide/nickel transport system permease protein
MTAFVLRRFLQAIVVMLVVALVAFSLFQYVGDPVQLMLGQFATPEDRVRLTHELGLDQPFYVQFFHFVVNAVHGQFGVSLRIGKPVSVLLAQRIPATLELSVCAALLALAVGIPGGVYAGLRPNSWLARAVLSLSLLGVSLPTFLIGILLILVFAVLLGWLPTITLGLFQLTLIMRLVRSEMLEVLRTDYVKFARARGLRDRAINFGHALKNTLVPVITITGLQLGSIIAFSIITEQVFQWPGMGLLFIQAVSYVDIPVMAAYLCLIALVFVTINLIVDLLYYVVDPRLRADRPGGAGR